MTVVQPFKRRIFAWLWLSIAAVLFTGAASAAESAPESVPPPEGVSVSAIAPGSGGSPTPQDVVFIRYRGMLEDGTVFDVSPDLPLPPEAQGLFPEGMPMPLADVIPGFREGITLMQKGGKYRLFIPSHLAYGPDSQTYPQTGVEVIPPNANLVFEVELIDFMSILDFSARAEAYEQAMLTAQAQRVNLSTIAPGLGGSPAPQDMVFIRYRGTLEDGTEFDKSQDLPLPPTVQSLLPEGTPMSLAEVIPGFRAGIIQMQKGGKYRILIPSDLAYGPEGVIDPQAGLQTIPPNADLIFEIELIDFMNDEDFYRRVQLAQQAVQAEEDAAAARQGEGAQ